ncbi:kinase-like domain-containing protein [Amylocarpus encephaloides]|uniref:EKC/KEOPS complex subunit BUD32 n=1 Tax=Amylocarpus encephaloides TaxID=45428 RepID=A0A9P8C2X4_9HELO|nr:kinase-like domain-containing protein [Amylocarpus encephaloides]
MAALKYYGSTSSFSRVRPGVILKSPTQVWEEKLTKEFARNFLVKRQIFDRLSDHPRIVRFTMGMQQGLLLAEASHGNLQQYIDENNSFIPLSLRKKWCRQTAESITNLHSLGVIHSDLRPDNFLVHATSTASLDIWLCDFGGSTCEELGLDGGHLPEAGFFDPTQEYVSTPATDIFSLGSILPCQDLSRPNYPTK